MIRSVELGPLGLGETEQLLADTFAARAKRRAAAGPRAARQDAGQPVLIAPFLRALERSGALFFERDACAWRWEMSLVESGLATDTTSSISCWSACGA